MAAGIAAPTFARMGWGTAFFDADLDGKLDLFVVNGHIFADIDDYPQLGETYRQKNQLLLNLGDRFRDVSPRAGAGLQVARVGRGLAVGDLDDDGDPDLVVSNMDDAPTLLENRQRTGHHWVAFRVAGPTGNRFAIGAKVTVEAARQKTDARDPIRRKLSLAERPPCVFRPGRPFRSRRPWRCACRAGGAGSGRARRRPPACPRALGRGFCTEGWCCAMNGVQVRIGARPSAFGVRRIWSFVLSRDAFSRARPVRIRADRRSERSSARGRRLSPQARRS